MEREIREEQLELIRKKNVRKQEVELTERDLRILEFVLEMKFSNAESIFQKFFKITFSGLEATSLGWTRKRLLQLERAGFLKTTYAFSEGTRYYLATRKAYEALSFYFPQSSFCYPLAQIDHRTFAHDKFILEYRVELEKRNSNCFWVSERMLKANPEFAFGLEGRYAPDATYMLSQREMVAFELEISLKAKSRYREKVRKYVYAIRNSKTSSIPLSKVHFVVLTDSVEKILKAETRIYPDYFQIERISSLDVPSKPSWLRTKSPKLVGERIVGAS